MRFLWILFLAPLGSLVAEKILVFVITSDQFPLYKALQTHWASYMNSDPEHIEVYFLRGNPDLEVPYKIDGHTIWAKTVEGWSPSPGIINKTVLAMEAMLPRLSEFQYVLRTNLSSFFVFPRLLEHVKTLPKTRCYAGGYIDRLPPGRWIASGAGILLSSDLVRLIVEHKQEFLDHGVPEDDVLIGKFLRGQGMALIPFERRFVGDLKSFLKQKKSIPKELFHFHVKTDDKHRFEDDMSIQTELLRIFYR